MAVTVAAVMVVTVVGKMGGDGGDDNGNCAKTLDVIVVAAVRMVTSGDRRDAEVMKVVEVRVVSEQRWQW